MIMLARDIGRDQPVLGVLDIAVNRNVRAPGGQLRGRSADSAIDRSRSRGGTMRPSSRVGGVEVLARLDDGRSPRCGRAKRWRPLPPELTQDDRLHRYFLGEVAGLPVEESAAPDRA